MESNERYMQIENVFKSFGGAAGTEVLRDVSLTVRKGEFVSIIGHSGCGKSTLLNIVAGLTPATAGNVFVDNRQVVEPGPDRAVVFQNHSLLPWLSVYQNVRLAVDKIFGDAMTKPERHEWTLRNLELVSMAEARNKNPAEISGGMRKRVAIARALVTEPEIVFFDEPTTGLDPILVNTIHHLIVDLHRKFRFTAVMVSHEIPEIFEVGDRVAMLHDGVIVEVGAPGAVRGSAKAVVQHFIRGEVEAVPADQSPRPVR